MSKPKEDPSQRMARALRLLLVPYKRVTDETLRSAYKDQRTPAGLGKHSPGEIIFARLALSEFEREPSR